MLVELDFSNTHSEQLLTMKHAGKRHAVVRTTDAAALKYLLNNK
jgi:hypothetical protein